MPSWRIGLDVALALAPLVLVPLALSMLVVPKRDGRPVAVEHWARRLHPAAAALVVVGLALEPGMFAALMTLPWLLEAALLACYGLWRLAGYGLSSLDDVVASGALLYLPLAAFWWLASAAGWSLGYSEVLVQLTAIHFHFAGFAAGAVAGLAGRRVLPSRRGWRAAYRAGALVVLFGPIMVAVGIAFSPATEVVAAIVLALGMSTLAVVLVAEVARKVPHRGAALLLTISGLALGIPMILAALYAVGELRGTVLVTVPTMARYHGLFNAFGFALCGLLSLRFAPTAARRSTLCPPFSRLSASRFVGPDFFDRMGLVHAGEPITGFVADMDAFARDGFAPSELHPAVRGFYQHTADYSIEATALWSPGFRLGGRVFRRFGRRVGQLGLPTNETHDQAMRSRLVALDGHRDGRGDVRAWVRTYVASGECVYAAAYALHRHEGIPYMNIAFPLPGGSLTSILRLDPVPGRPGGLALGTLPAGDKHGDEGVYYANRWLPIRLPLNELITVWVEPSEERDERVGTDAPVRARHDMWLFGLRYLRIDYVLTRELEG